MYRHIDSVWMVSYFLFSDSTGFLLIFLFTDISLAVYCLLFIFQRKWRMKCQRAYLMENSHIEAHTNRNLAMEKYTKEKRTPKPRFSNWARILIKVNGYCFHTRHLMKDISTIGMNAKIRLLTSAYWMGFSYHLFKLFHAAHRYDNSIYCQIPLSNWYLFFRHFRMLVGLSLSFHHSSEDVGDYLFWTICNNLVLFILCRCCDLLSNQVRGFFFFSFEFYTNQLRFVLILRFSFVLRLQNPIVLSVQLV